MEGHPRRSRTSFERPAEFVSIPLDRRRFLVMLGGAAACAALSPGLAWAERLARHPSLQPWTLPETLPTGPIEAARALIGAAILAPSYWNAQPWRFEVDATEMRLTLDPSRTLPGSDPDQRFAQISLGASLENLLVAARAWGQRPAVTYLPWGRTPRAGSPLVVANITWESADQRRDVALFEAITRRRSNPHHFDGRAITLQHRAQLLAQIPDELNLRWLEDRAEIRNLGTLVHDATEACARTPRVRAERAHWMRDGEGEARRHGDGVTPEGLGLTGPLGWLAARTLGPRGRAWAWGSGSIAHEAADAVRSSGALALLTAPHRQDATFLLAGQAYERFALKATSLGLAQQPLSAPIESERYRALIAKRFGAAPGEEPLLLVRLGHARPAEATPRRAVALVSTWRAS
jgi:nitroreductase